MANQVEPVIIQSLLQKLQDERFVTIATVDHETGGPNVSAISWLYAKDERTVRFAVDNRSRIVKNVKQNELVVINVIVNETTYSIGGKAYFLSELAHDVPLKLAIAEVIVDEVRDVMFYGSKITVEPKYDKTYDLDAATRLDQQVMECLRKA